MLALAFLAATAIGGAAWVFIYPMLSGERQAEAAARRSQNRTRCAAVDSKNQRTRREQVEGSLRELETRRAKESKVPLATRLTQAGLGWSPQKFIIISAILGLIAFAIAMLPALSRSVSSGTAPVVVDAESSRPHSKSPPGILSWSICVAISGTCGPKIRRSRMRPCVRDSKFTSRACRGANRRGGFGRAGQPVATYDISLGPSQPGAA